MPSDYKIAGAAHKSARPGAGGSARPAGSPTVEDFVQLLARAIRQFHTYPPTSQLCIDAVGECHKAFAALERPDRLALRILPSELIADATGFGRGTIIEHELVRRLHRANVAELEIDRAASPRDFMRFCIDVIRCDDLARTGTTFAELLAEHGIETIVPRLARRPEVLDIGSRPAPLWNLVEAQRKRKPAPLAGERVTYLYPPEKGWIRLAPAATVDALSLVDLATLVDDPAEIATMLLRLTDEDPVEPAAREQALEQKFSDVATLVAALDGHLAQVMFGKLARAVLALEPDRRNELLRRTILPGLLDGRPDGAVLRSFPDPDLAESLCLLLELETAAPEVVTTALNRLDLAADRRQAVVSLVDRRLQSGEPLHPGADREREQHGIERFARRLIRIDAAPGKSFSEFAAFDLSIDDQAAAAIARVRETVAGTDLPVTQIECLWRLVRLEPNPRLVESFMRRALTLLGDMERTGRWRDLAAEASRYRQLAGALKQGRPDVADAIVAALAGFCTRSRARALLDLHDCDAEGRASATVLIEAFGESLAPGFAALLDDPSLQSKTHSLTRIMCEHAAALAPGLVGRLGHGGLASTRAIARVCGFAGAGYEVAIAGQLTSQDELTVREALRALARIGTARAAALVGSQIQNGTPGVRAAAAEALWHLPPARLAAQLRELLRDREFVARNPQLVERLIDRARKTGAAGLEGVIEELEALRFRFWSPGLVRVAWKAREFRDR
jgi:hypothetical protein